MSEGEQVSDQNHKHNVNLEQAEQSKVKIKMKVKWLIRPLESNMLADTDVEDHYHPSVRLLEIERSSSGNCGFHLTRGKWDPYPWVSEVDAGTASDNAGLKPGDCVLEVNGEDIVGQRISEVAEIVKSRPDQVALLIWNAGIDPYCTPEALCCGPMPTNLQRLSACMSTILAFLECPVCLDTIVPPTYQCDNGHLTCIRCRAKSERCPICRMKFSRGRSLLADQVYNALIDAFNLRDETEETRTVKMQQIFKLKNKQKNIPDIKVTQSHTNKFLDKIKGKSSSVDNLSQNSRYLSPSNATEGEFGSDLKVRSLSNNEIFHSNSSLVTRCGSMGKLGKTAKGRQLNLNIQSRTRPASYHGSFETLARKTDGSLNNLASPFVDDGVLFHCPFKAECPTLIRVTDLVDHFQIKHYGPLVQYFTSRVTISLKRIMEDSNICNIIHFDSNLFILKINLENCNTDESQMDDILIWMWYLGKAKTCCDHQMKILIKNSKTNTVLLSVFNSIISLHHASAQDIKSNRKGVFLNAKTLEALNHTTSNIVFDIEIVKTDCS